MKTKRLMATLLTVIMLVTMMPAGLVFSAEEVTSSGIEFSKTATLKEDGTAEIVMEAYTTGTVTQTQTVVPTDIVLVLDMSGSMDDIAAHSPHGVEVLGTRWTPLFSARYGFEDEEDYYILNDSDELVRVTFAGYDDSSFGVGVGHQYYTDGTNYYYPKLGDGISTSGRNESYPEKQFYRDMTHLEILREGADAFIENVAAKNALIEDSANKHRISIVKFGSADYYSGSGATDNHTLAVIGNNRNSSGYNYTQVVKDLTIVDAAGKTELIAAMDSLVSGGATAVDYGIQLAEDVLGKRVDAANRNEAIIVFTDGSPTHSSSYDAAVAGSAINEALALKQAGVKVFSIGGADSADSSVLGDASNQFMHYISNNYPDAGYSGGNITPGAGSIDGGYYMTPSDDRNLESIFSDILDQTTELGIVMGETAGVIDTISPYFEVPGGTAGVKLEVADKTATGWAGAEAAAGVTPIVNGNTLSVHGFDFDENYVSTSPRQVGGQDFYGRKLIITISVEPDFDEIDIHKASFANGAIPTNEGKAAVVDSVGTVVASKASPTVNAKKVTYKVDGEEYDYFYRFPGSKYKIIAEPEKEGHKFSGWKMGGVDVNPGDEFTMSDDVVIEGSFEAEKYNVSYQFSGEQPAGITVTIPSDYASQEEYDSTVKVKPDLAQQGYVFSGWYPQQTDVAVDEDDNFTMPAKDVVFLGYFTAADNTPYKVHHYLMKTDGSYDKTAPAVIEPGSGTTGQTVTIYPDTMLLTDGYEYDLEYSLAQNGNTVGDEAVSKVIEDSGNTVIELFYKRIEYTVTYQLDRLDSVPEIAAAAQALVPTDSDSPYRFGETVRIKDNISIEGYTFSGWHTHSTEGALIIENNKFEMPARNVVLHGNFEPNTDTPYKIEHYVQNTSLDGYELKTTRDATGTTATTVTASPLPEITEAGYEYDLAYSLAQNGNDASAAAVSGVIAADGNLVLKLYYTRKQFNVIYKFEGNLPNGISASDVPVHGKTEAHGAMVTVKDLEAIVPDGYTFKGWYRGAYDANASALTTFEMPAHDVTILGHFEPDDGILYKVKHYLADADGNYPADDAPDIVENFAGTTDEWVVAEFLPNLLSEGYEADLVHSLEVNQQLASDTEVKGQIIGDGSLVLKLYYKRSTYNVVYVLERLDNIPADVKATAEGMIPVDTNSYRFGQTVDVADNLVIEGYTFSGWHAHSTDGSLNISNDQFEMPKRKVTLYGYFEPRHDTAYIVQHYTEKADGTGYELKAERSATGTTGMTITAEPIAEITEAGYEYNLAYSLAQNGNDASAPAVSGVIKADGSLIIKLYYDRRAFEVSYKYEGILPNVTLPTLPAGGSFKYKSNVPVAAPVALDGYTFVGWYRGTEDTPAGTSFEMPAHNVILLGKFVPNDNTPYHIRHFLRKLNAAGDDVSSTGDKAVDYELDASASVTRYGTTNTAISAVNREYPGFEYNAGISTPSGTIAASGLTYLDFYYERADYSVEYILDGTQPHGITVTVPNTYNHTAKYGATVDVKADLEQEGYTFEGWVSDDPAIGDNDANFTMPDKKVTLKGKFVANTDTPYKVNYYLQKLNADETEVVDDYDLKETTEKTGTTGHTVTAEIKHYEGFVPWVNNEISKVLLASDPIMEINIYYDRVVNPVIYHYYGDATPHTDAELPAKADVPYGVKVTVAPKATCAEHKHSFSDWASPHVTIENNKFTMPASKVEIYTEARMHYTVEYDLDGGTGAADVLYSDFDVIGGTVIEVKPAPTKGGFTFVGWKLDGTETIYEPDDEIVVDKDLKFIAQWERSGGGTPGGGGGSSKYTLTYESNGGTEYGNERHDAGKTVEIDKKPEKADYIFEGWYEDEELTKPVTEVKMTRNITVYAKWVKDNGAAGNGYSTPGSLNGKDHFAYVVGYPDGTVRPDAHIDRAEVTTIFFRLLKAELRDGNLTDENGFEDVKENAWYNKAVSTMAKLGIIKGRTEKGFVPDGDITRAEFAAICARFDESEFEVIDNFTDVQGHWAEDYIHEAAAHGWIRGYEDGTFKPDQLITRAEAMTMINRVLNRVPETKDDLHSDMVKWPDNSDTDAWYYLPIQEATNSHEYKMKNHIYEEWIVLRANADWTKYQ